MLLGRALSNSIIAVVVRNVQTQSSRRNVPVTEDQCDAEDWFGDQIQNSVEDGFSVRRDDLGVVSDW